MLYIVVSAKPGDKSNPEYQWHVGDEKPKVYDTVIEVQADSDELDFIAVKFQNIPMAKQAVVTWKGDMAQFIYDNLCIEPEVRHTPDCNCQAEYGETCSLSFMSGKAT